MQLYATFCARLRVFVCARRSTLFRRLNSRATAAHSTSTVGRGDQIGSGRAQHVTCHAKHEHVKCQQ